MDDTSVTTMREAATALSTMDLALSAKLFRAAIEVERMTHTLDEITRDAIEDEAAVVPLIVRKTATGRRMFLVQGRG